MKQYISLSFLLTGCESYGSTYIENFNLDLDVPHTAEYTGISLEDCQAYCSQSTTCRGVNYCQTCMGGMCRLKSDMNLSMFQMKQGVHFYTRNCA